MAGGEHSLKSSVPQLLRLGIDSVLKVLNKRMTQLMNHKGVYRTAPATPALLHKLLLRSIALDCIGGLENKTQIGDFLKKIFCPKLVGIG